MLFEKLFQDSTINLDLPRYVGPDLDANCLQKLSSADYAGRQRVKSFLK